MTQIRLENISKNFGSVPVISGLAITIEEGEFFTFVGPSGCGKSTVLNLIAGLETPTAGSILFDGIPVTDRSPKDRDVAMVFQSYALYPHMTVRDNIAFPLRMKKEQEHYVVREVGKVAELLGLGNLLDRKPRELSGGQRQRVALGRAIVRRPKVFLMDEPLSNLDARLRIDMRAELKDLHRNLGITTVYVTHDQSEAMGLSERMAVLEKGTIRQVGTPRDVYRRPADLFVAGFIGSPPMNLFSCRVLGSAPFEIDCLGRRIAPATDGRPRGAEVIAGLRPENLSVAAQNGEGAVEVPVLATELAGAVLWVDVKWRDAAIRTMARPTDEFKEGDRVFLRFTADDIVVFDKETGARI
ncbi:MAG: ABC transporter ATP-binding protein [Nitrospirota bacterium]